MALCQMIHEVLRRCDEIVLYNKTRRFDLADLVGSRDRDPQSAYEKNPNPTASESDIKPCTGSCKLW